MLPSALCAKLESAMQVNLKLSQMGLILLGIPAAFEILFVVALFVLLQQADLELKKESHSKDVIAHAHGLSERITNAAISIGAYGYSKSPLAKQTYEAAVRSMQRELNQLTSLLKNDAVQLKRLLALSENADEALKVIDDARKSIEGSSTLALLGGDTTMSDSLDKLSQLVGKIQKQIDELVRAEQASSKDLPAKRARSRQLLLLVMAIGAALNIALAFTLAVFFSRIVTKRQLVLVDNTIRLSKAQELHPPLAGNDEIAQLDRVFHKMVEDLAAASEFKKQLIGVVSHELRAPLTSIDAILTFLEAGGMGDLPEGVTRRLNTAGSEVQRLIALVNDLLDVERMEAGKFEMAFKDVPVQSILERSTASISGALQEKQIRICAETTDLHVWADENRLVQVLINLLSNAIKFSPQQGKIIVATADLGKQVKISVQDEGRGVPEEFKNKIFERFSQVEKTDSSVRGGTGLGLTICKTIVTQHRGNIGVESREGQGSTFWFCIPKESES